MSRYIALDIGDKRIGIAVSDPFDGYALPSQTYWRKGFNEDIAAVLDIAVQKGASVIVCGLPVNSDGTPSAQTEKAARFIEALKQKTSLTVVCADERYTTLVAHEQLYQSGKNSRQHKNYVDALAAASILDGYLSSLKNNKGEHNLMKDEEKIPEEEDVIDEADIDTEEEDEEDQIVELIDDEGNVVKFRLLDVTEYKGEKYTLLLAAEPNDEIAEDEVVIFRLNEKEEVLEPIEDDALLQEVFDFYVAEEDELN